MAKEVTIDHTKIGQMLRIPELMAMLPPLQNLKKRSAGQKPCRCNEKQNITYAEKDSALREIASLLSGDPTLLAKVKSQFGATTLKIRFRKLGNKSLDTKKV